MQVKKPTEVNFKHGGGQKILHSQTYSLLSHFQNNGATVECCTYILILQIQLVILCF